MHVRPLTVPELPLCESFARAFYVEKQVPGDFRMDVFLKNWTTWLSSYPAILLALWDETVLVGGLGGMLSPDMFDGRLTASEFFWYVTPAARHGRGAFQLLAAFETWGRAQGATEVRMVHLLLPGEDPATVRLGRIYERLKYRPLEVGYIKTL